MRFFLNLVLSIVVLAGTVAAALALAAARYDDAGHDLSVALIASAVACVGCIVAAMVMPLILTQTLFARKTLVYVFLAICATAAVGIHCIGFDGILPRPDGTPDVGFAAVIANADLFALVIAGVGIAGRGFLR